MSHAWQSTLDRNRGPSAGPQPSLPDFRVLFAMVDGTTFQILCRENVILYMPYANTYLFIFISSNQIDSK